MSLPTRIASVFAALRQKHEAALVVYLTAGDGGADATADYIVAAANAGADLIELGIPWSDPSADGPVIEAAMGRALATGMAPHTFDKTLAIVRAVRTRSAVPIVLFGYLNPLFQYRFERAADAAHDAGADGFLIVDLPADEDDALANAARRAGLDLVHLIAPTTPTERAQLVARHSTGFVYYVTMTGVTGARSVDAAAVRAEVARLRPALHDLPLVAGFGIRSPADVAALAPEVDGVVVGSAIVKLLYDLRDEPHPLRTAALERTVAALKSACKRA